LPWRRTRDPWLTLIAPVLLRKTTGKQVAAVYEEFAKRYSSPAALARAPASEVADLIGALGLSKRATQMKKLASEIVEVHGGSVPATLEQLEQLPLVGRYAASEVLSVAYGRDEPAMDRNMIRILQRVFSAKSYRKRPHTDKKMWDFARSAVPEGRSREYNYAIMDFAHSVCRARQPLCETCLMNDICDYGAARGRPEGERRLD
jgi:A/G-specific adenine glycosylase